MKLYHCRFTGRHRGDFKSPCPTTREVIIRADSIYQAQDELEHKYHFITGLCLTSLEHYSTNVFELAR